MIPDSVLRLVQSDVYRFNKGSHSSQCSYDDGEEERGVHDIGFIVMRAPALVVTYFATP